MELSVNIICAFLMVLAAGIVRGLSDAEEAEVKLVDALLCKKPSIFTYYAIISAFAPGNEEKRLYATTPNVEKVLPGFITWLRQYVGHTTPFRFTGPKWDDLTDQVKTNIKGTFRTNALTKLDLTEAQIRTLAGEKGVTQFNQLIDHAFFPGNDITDTGFALSRVKTDGANKQANEEWDVPETKPHFY